MEKGGVGSRHKPVIDKKTTRNTKHMKEEYHA